MIPADSFARLDHLAQSILSLTNILQDAGPLMDSLETLTGEDLPSTLDATQTSLETAQQSADIIDNLLRTLSRIPFSLETPTILKSH
jgi:hypothetical protein